MKFRLFIQWFCVVLWGTLGITIINKTGVKEQFAIWTVLSVLMLYLDEEDFKGNKR